MYDIFLCKIEITFDDLLHVIDSFFLVETFFEGFVEIGVTKLGDDIGVIFSSVNLMQRKDVG